MYRNAILRQKNENEFKVQLLKKSKNQKINIPFLRLELIFLNPLMGLQKVSHIYTYNLLYYSFYVLWIDERLG